MSLMDLLIIYLLTLSVDSYLLLIYLELFTCLSLARNPLSISLSYDALDVSDCEWPRRKSVIAISRLDFIVIFVCNEL